MESKQWCKGLFRLRIGNGEGTSLWFDYWLSDGHSLFDTFLARVLATTGLAWNAKVDTIINDGGWSFPNGHQDLQ